MRLHPSTTGRRRRGVAAVEFAFVVPLLLLLLLGIWELGRIINVQITLNNAARDGARLGAQANIVNMTGAYTQIKYGTGTPNIEGAIRAYLQAAGITNLNGLVIQFQFASAGTGGTMPGEPATITTSDVVGVWQTGMFNGQQYGVGMCGMENQITGWAVNVFAVKDTNLYANPPVLDPAQGQVWTSAVFHQQIAVQV